MPVFDRSFRIVCKPELVKAVEALLEAEGFRFSPEPFSDWCRKLLEEPFPLGSSLAAFFGYIYIQDRSSMLPPLALDPQPGSVVLDLAASPGSKSGFLAQLTGETGFVLANEPNKSRLATLRHNLAIANLLQAGTCSYPGESIPLPNGVWPYILLDPPCSGWGTATKHPQAPKLWQGEKIEKLIILQRRLLTRAAELLAHNGRLLYSTCTTNPDENEAQTQFAIDKLGLSPVALEPFKGFIFDKSLPGSLLVNGDASQSQGFYLSLLVQTNPVNAEQAPLASYSPLIPREELASPVCDPALLGAGIIGEFGNKARFIPAKAKFPQNFRWQGALLGKISGGHFSPDPRLRRLLPPLSANSQQIRISETSEIRQLLSGSTLFSDLKTPAAALWWRDLPLGIVQLKNGRVIANFK